MEHQADRDCQAFQDKRLKNKLMHCMYMYQNINKLLE